MDNGDDGRTHFIRFAVIQQLAQLLSFQSTCAPVEMRKTGDIPRLEDDLRKTCK